MSSLAPLSLFISSKMQELTEERHAIQAALKEVLMHGWLWETDAGARPEPIQSTYLTEVANCDIYLGLFWQGYGPYTIEEYEHARTLNKPCLIYEKHVDRTQRDPRLTMFLDGLQQVTSPKGLTVHRFQNERELATFVQEDVMRLLTTIFRESRQQPQQLWNVPYRRNLFFTGREHLLEQLHKRLHPGKSTALSQSQAISGLGGIGKTQIALEYAYRFRQDYRVVLWVSAATQETLTTEVTSLAHTLELPERDAQDQTKIAAAVEHWLQEHDGWLLILDNADDLTLVEDFLPPNHKGTVLFTTRSAYAGPLTVVLEVEPMDEQEGMLLLLRRARLLARDDTLEHVDPQRLAEARATVTALDGLPLALDQAGAYIEETKSSLASYLAIYHTRRKELLARRSRSRSAHPDTVATTWSLAFEKVEAENQTAITLLRLCAFLASDAIPEEVVSEGRLDDYELNEAIEVVLRFSLVKRQSEEHLLSMHRLVQAVIQDSMEEPRQREWTQRAVRAVNAAFPKVEHQTWPQCDRLLPHALLCAELIAQEQMTFPEATRLLNQTGVYLNERARYGEAEPLLVRALAIREQQVGALHPNTAQSLNNLALLYSNQGKYEQAEPLFQQVLSTYEQQLGPEHPDTANSLNNLALLYSNQGKYEQAESLFQRALAIREQQLGAQHPDTALSLNNLAALYQVQGKYEQAEPLLVRALAIREQQVGPQHPNTADSVWGLAVLCKQQQQYEQAASLYQRAFSIYERALGPQHPTTQAIRANYADLLRTMGHDAEAAALNQP